MGTEQEIIGEEWAQRASELADWAMLRLVNRKDVWGQYSVLTPAERRRSGKTYKAMTLPIKEQRGPDRVTLDKLTRHFASRHLRKPQIIGLHAKSQEGLSKWFAIDIDLHDEGVADAQDYARRNLNAALAFCRQFQAAGYDPMLFNSNGYGGFHIWVLQRVKKDSIGSWFRLPGLHHSRPVYSSLWSWDEWLDDPWLEGHAAIDAMLDNIPGPPPPTVKNVDVKAPRKTLRSTRNSFQSKNKPKVCVDLDGVLAEPINGKLTEIGPPVSGALEFMRSLAEKAEIIILTSRPLVRYS